MSEFRKYRLVCKLLDSFGNVSAPQKYVTILSNGDLELEKVGIPAELSKVLKLVQCLASNHTQDVPFQSILSERAAVEKGVDGVRPDHLEPALEELKPRLEGIKISQHASDDYELDETQHRLGIFDSRGLQLPASQDGNTEIQLRSFKNDFEWSAGNFPLPVQEIFVIEDLLFLLLGLSGRYICREKTESWNFLIDDSMSGTIVESILPVLKTSCCFDYLEDFVHRRCAYADGRVCQALTAGIQELLQEFRQVIVLLEKKFLIGALGLQQFAFHLQPYARNLQIIYEIVSAVEQGKLCGGAILVELEKGVARYAGDKVLRALLEEILVKCSIPFMALTASWIQDGRLEDHCHEFFIRPRTDLDKSPSNETDSFASAFVLVDANIPSIFQPAVNKILQIGAYHNILRGYASDPEDYRGEVNALLDGHMSYDQRKITAMVDRAFVCVSASMLSYLTCRMCKNYYFADNCDLLHSFLDFNRAELDKPATMVISEHVQSGWENALRTFPPFIDGKHRVQCYQAEFSLTEQLQRIISSSESGSGRLTDTTPTRGLDLLSIKIDFEFPDTLIFNRENLAKYELLFRLIFRLVDLSRELNGPSDLSSAPRGLRKSFLILRRQMLHFVQNMHQYLIYEVIEPQWSTLTEAISAATGMDSIVQLHTQFIDACLRQAMLTNAKLVQIANVLFTQCQRLLSIKTEGLNSTDAQARLSTTQSAFNKTMRMFLEALQYYSSRDYDYHLGTLFSRLDYCSFYYATSFGADAMNGSTTGGVTDRRSTLGASSIL